MTALATVVGKGAIGSRPAAGNPGRIYFSTEPKTYRDNGSSWDDVSDAGGFTNPMTTKGDVIVGDTGGAAIRKAVGSDGQVLTADAASTGGIKWATAGGGGGALAAHPLPLDSYAIDGTYGDDFTAGSLSGSWTRRNYTSGAESYQKGEAGTWLKVAMNGRAVGDGYFRTAPAGDWTFGMAMNLEVGQQLSAYANHWGLAVVDTAGTGVGFAIYHGTPNAPLIQGITTYTTSSGSYYEPWKGSSASPNVALDLPGYRKVWYYIRKSGTNYYCSYSLDGEIWAEEGGPLAWSGTVDRVAMMNVPLASTSIASADIVYVDWFNKIA